MTDPFDAPPQANDPFDAPPGGASGGGQKYTFEQLMKDTQNRSITGVDELPGAADAVVGMIAGLPGQVIGGLHGASTLLAGQGLDKAVERMNKTTDYFGYKPLTKKGGENIEKIGELMAVPGQKVREAVTPYLGELGGTNAQIATDAILNLVDPALAVGAFKGVKKTRAQLKKDMEAKPVEEAPKSRVAEILDAQDPFNQPPTGQMEMFPTEGAGPSLKPAEAGAGPMQPEPRGQLSNRRQMELQLDQNPTFPVDPAGSIIPREMTPTDVLAQERAGRMQEAELNAMRPLENQTSLEGPDGQMSLFDQADQMGQRNQFNAGNLGDWRIDENGMPVRADLSIEAKQLGQPLQRNFWGDELGPALGQDRGLTQALDSIPDTPFKGDARDQALAALGDPRAQTNLFSAGIVPLDENGKPIGRLAPGSLHGNDKLEYPELSLAPLGENITQRNFQPNAKDKSGAPIEITRSVEQSGITYKTYNDKGDVVAQVQFEQTPEGNLSAGMAQSFDKGKGLAEAMYRKAKDEGFTIVPGRAQTADGAAMVKSLQAKGIIEPGPITPIGDLMREIETVKDTMPSQTAVPSSVDSIVPPVREDTVQKPTSPETIAQKEKARTAASILPTKDERLQDFRSISTPEEALAVAGKEGWKDNAPSIVGRNLGSGSVFHSVNTGNPLIQYMSTVFRDARNAATNFSKQFITAKDGLSPTWSKMSSAERVEVAQTLIEGDKRQTRITDNLMQRAGFSDLQRQYINKFYEGNGQLYTMGNDARAQIGLKPMDYREGHVPGVFKGAYRSIVTGPDGVKAVIAVDTKGQMELAKAALKERFPDATFSDVDRKGLGGSGTRSDIFSGMNDMLTLLAQNDPRFAEVQAAVQEAVRKGSHSMFNFNVHDLQKKGVVGSEGNKPWLDAKQNAEDFHKAMIQYFEDGATHHAMQVPINDVGKIIADQDVPMPKTKKYMETYLENVQGQLANNAVGKFGNYLIDTPGRLLGFGPGTSLAVSGALKNRVSQLFMGYFNWAFTAAQFAQMGQTGLPVMANMAGKLGMTHYVPQAMIKGNVDFYRGALGMNLSPDMKAAFEYAKSHGMMDFSELERAYEGSRHKAVQIADSAIEANMRIGELATRTPMFMSFVDLQRKAGVPLDQALRQAEVATQYSMFDYHQMERPPIYQRLGVLGNFAGALTTFKHGYIGNQVKHITDFAKGDMKGAAASAAAALLLMGVSGLPGYDEVDTLFGEITDKFFDKKMNMRDTLMTNLPEWVKSGVLSASTDINAQSKFSAANMIPDSPAQALSPQLAHVGQLGKDVYDVAKNQDRQSVAGLAMDLTPSGLKGVTENYMLRGTPGPQGNPDMLLDRQLNAKYPRTEAEWNKRMWTGMRSQTETNVSNSLFKAREADKADQEAKKEITKDLERKFFNKQLSKEVAEKLVEKYKNRGGDPAELLSEQRAESLGLRQFVDAEKRRAAQLKDTTGSIRQFQNYKNPRE